MKVTLIYLHVVGKGYPEASPPEYYLPFSERWKRTYHMYKPSVPHEVRVVCCGGEKTPAIESLYYSLMCGYDTYLGGGSDIGACQYAMKNVDSDFVVCMSTPVYFWRHGWLERLIAAREFYGDGLYGPMASYENSPHIRTSCWAVSPKTFGIYPHVIDTREKCCWAESFDHNNECWHIANWYETIEKPTMMVTWDSVHAKCEWRTPPNIFRRGDQSNCIVWDQHVDKYFAAHYHERIELSRKADTGS